jgi:hypothetical protein
VRALDARRRELPKVSFARCFRDRIAREAELGETDVFDGYPYLSIALTPAVHHLSVLPRGCVDGLRDFAHLQVTANRLPVCLAIEPNRTLRVDADGREREHRGLPESALALTDGLEVVARCDDDDVDVAERRARLAAYAADLLWRGDRDLARLRRVRAFVRFGIPTIAYSPPRHAGAEPCDLRGLLDRCSRCGALRGNLLATQAGSGAHRVECRCANDNRCAGCLTPLAAWRLGSFYYDEAAGRVAYLSPLAALGHRCPDRNATGPGA